VIDAQYGDAVTLHLKMKCSQAEEFRQAAFDLLRGALEDLSEQQEN
jgi:hypothetical protein